MLPGSDPLIDPTDGRHVLFVWSTHDELDFLRHLGEHLLRGFGPHPPVETAHRLVLLQDYRRQMATRTRWGAIDPAKLAAGLTALIADLQGPTHAAP